MRIAILTYFGYPKCKRFHSRYHSIIRTVLGSATWYSIKSKRSIKYLSIIRLLSSKADSELH